MFLASAKPRVDFYGSFYGRTNKHVLIVPRVLPSHGAKDSITIGRPSHCVRAHRNIRSCNYKTGNDGSLFLSFSSPPSPLSLSLIVDNNEQTRFNNHAGCIMHTFESSAYNLIRLNGAREEGGRGRKKRAESANREIPELIPGISKYSQNRGSKSFMLIIIGSRRENFHFKFGRALHAPRKRNG